MSESEIYPCKDLPVTCGWTKDETCCLYPNCWCKDWLVGAPLTNKLIIKGQDFSAILYRGKSEVVADAIFKTFKSAKDENRSVPLTDSMYSIHVFNVELVQMCGVYQVDITGELE